MKRPMLATGFVVFLLSTKSYAQSAAVIPPATANDSQAPQASCVILQRMGRADRTKSRLYSFGISGKQFRYVEGKLPEGFSLHHKMTDHDVRSLQAHGAQVLVLDSNYTSDDLKEARANCLEGTGEIPTQAEARVSAAPGTASMATTPEPATKPSTAKPPAAKLPVPKTTNSSSFAVTTVAALIDVSSTPTGADVYIDEQFFGRTPAATILLIPGDHEIAVKKDGFVVWKKKVNLPSGRTNVEAKLLPKTK